MDFAELGIKIDTKNLDLTVQQLKKLSPAAAGASAATDKLSRAVQGLSVSTNRAAVAAATRAKREAELNLAKVKAANGDVAAAKAALNKADMDLKAARAAQARTREVNELARAEQRATRVTAAATVAGRKQSAGLNAIAGGLTGIPANDQMPNRFNTANIAAQFQDIGVTAAMGMNPLTIALQQGTQLSAILNSMENPLKGISAAFTSIINPVSLLSIGLVALIATGLQLVDWTSVASSGLNMLADVFDVVADGADVATPYVLGLGVALTYLYRAEIVAGLSYVVRGLYAIAVAAGVAIASIMTPVNLLIAGYVLVGAATAALVNEIGKMIGLDMVNMFYRAVNQVIGLFVGLASGIGQLFTRTNWFKLLVYGFVEVANFIAQGVADLMNDIITVYDETVRFFGGEGTDFRVNAVLLEQPFAEEGAKAGQIFSQAFADSMNKDYIGYVGDVVGNTASSLADKLRGMAESVAAGESEDSKKSKGGKTEAEKYADIIKSANLRIKTLKDEQLMLSMTAKEAAIYKEQQDLINDALRQGIVLSPEQTAQLKSLGSEMAGIAEETRRTKEAFDFLRDTGKSFFQDMKSGLQEGKGLWASFADSVINALNRIVDKIFESALDDVFNNIGTSSVGGGDFLSGIGNFLFSAKGNAFNQSGVTPFAKGGAFTNSIVSSPTMFTFANGGKFGVMGEAGPEAVMPLQRGSDGSLGVKAIGGGSSGVVVNVINNSGAQARTEQRETSQGTEIDVIIDEMIAGKLESRGTASDRALNNRGNRQLVRR